MMGYSQELFGYIDDKGIVYKYDNNKKDIENEVIIKDTVLTGRKYGKHKVLGYYDEYLIIVDKDNICYQLDF